VRPAASLGEASTPVWIGLTDAHGAFHAATDHPGPFDVTLQLPGYRSPSSPSDDPFAPSAAMKDVSAEALPTLTIALERSPDLAGLPELPGPALARLGETLAEGVPVGAGWLAGDRDVGVRVSCESALRVTLLHHDAGLGGSLGWFVWAPGLDGAPQILDAGPAIPEGAALDLGTSWSLALAGGAPRLFAPGERIGLFFARAPGGADVVPSSSAAVNAVTAGGVLLTLDLLDPERASEPELAAHFVALPFAATPGVLGGGPYAVLGLEQSARDHGADDDFNDLVLAVHADQPDCLDLSALGAQIAATDDPDGDGVPGLSDAFPADADRAFILGAPAFGRQSVAFEDTYPAHGDDDFNDAVIRYALAETRSASGEIRDLSGTFHLVARGAGLDHTFFLGYPALPAGVSGSVAIERFTSSGVASFEAPAWDTLVVTSPDGARLLRLPVFPSTKGMLPSSNTGAVLPAALPASARFVVHLSKGVAANLGFGSLSDDPALGVKRDGALWDVHLPGHPGFADRPASLPVEEGAEAFVDAHGPWAVRIPSDFRYPLEKISITDAFPGYAAWLASGGAAQSGWFLTPIEGLVVIAPAADFHRRIWSIALTSP
jgi:LruC domain-containing protein